MTVNIIDETMKEILPDEGKVFRNKENGDYVHSINAPLSFKLDGFEEVLEPEIEEM